MILSRELIIQRNIIQNPDFECFSKSGYEIRLEKPIHLKGGTIFIISTKEKFKIPNDVRGRIFSSSNNSNIGLFVASNAIGPDYYGSVGIQFYYAGSTDMAIVPGTTIAEIEFSFISSVNQK